MTHIHTLSFSTSVSMSNTYMLIILTKTHEKFMLIYNSYTYKHILSSKHTNATYKHARPLITFNMKT